MFQNYKIGKESFTLLFRNFFAENYFSCFLDHTQNLAPFCLGIAGCSGLLWYYIAFFGFKLTDFTLFHYCIRMYVCVGISSFVAFTA